MSVEYPDPARRPDAAAAAAIFLAAAAAAAPAPLLIDCADTYCAGPADRSPGRTRVERGAWGWRPRRGGGPREHWHG